MPRRKNTLEERQANVMRISAAAAYLGVTERTFYTWVQAGRLPKGIKLSRQCVVWKRSELDDFIEQCRIAG